MRRGSLLPLLFLLAVIPSPLGCGDCDLEITTAALPDGEVGVSYSTSLDSHCGGDTWFVQDGLLPPGIGLLEDGVLRGVPTIAGVFSFTLGVIDDDDGELAFKGFALTVNEAP